MQDIKTLQNKLDDLTRQISAYYLANPAAVMGVKKELKDVKDIIEDLNTLYGDVGVLSLVLQPNPYNLLHLLGFDLSNQDDAKLPQANTDVLSEGDKLLFELAQSIQTPPISRAPLSMDTKPNELKRFASTAPAELVNEVGGYRAFKFSLIDRFNPSRRKQLIERINTYLGKDLQQDVRHAEKATQELIDQIANNLCKIIEEVLGDTIDSTFKLAQEGGLKASVLQLVTPDTQADSQTNAVRLKENSTVIANLEQILKMFYSAQSVIHESVDESLLEQIFKTLTIDQRRLVAQKASDNINTSFAKYDRQKLASILQ